jgi:AbrB family looped-hinge helix DNA binding protein
MKTDPKLQFFGTVTVGERGQISIPQEARELYDIKPGDKLLVVSSLFGGVALIPEIIVTDLIETAYADALKNITTAKVKK